MPEKMSQVDVTDEAANGKRLWNKEHSCPYLMQDVVLHVRVEKEGVVYSTFGLLRNSVSRDSLAFRPHALGRHLCTIVMPVSPCLSTCFAVLYGRVELA